MSEPVLNSVASASELVVRFGNQVVLDRATATILEGELDVSADRGRSDET